LATLQLDFSVKQCELAPTRIVTVICSYSVFPLNIYIEILIVMFHVSCFHLSPCHLAVLDKDFTSAKALYEQMQKEGLAVDELSLKRLAGLYREARETVPFTEPPVSHINTHTNTHRR